MRLKTFLATYTLFLLIMFSTITIVSVYMTTSQMNMLRDKSAGQYQTISSSLSRDITVLYGRNVGGLDINFYESVQSLMRGYAMYYRRHNIDVSLTALQAAEWENTGLPDAELTFIQRDREHFIHISGYLSVPFRVFRLDYYFDISENVMGMRNIQNVLLLFSILFSVIAAFGLYFILSYIFKPISVIAATSRKIADGDFTERIQIKGKSELSSMALDFNQMAEQIETQIRMLEEEAAQKQQFIDNFAHEIRTPLTSIYGYAEFIQKTPFDENETIESTQLIMDKATHMKSIADSLLKLATLRNYKPNKTEIRLPELFDDIEQTLNKLLNEKKIKFSKKADVEFLDGQEDLIKSLLLNLCYNSIKYCAPGSGIVNLKAAKENDKIILSVTDNGCGMSSYDAERVIRPFYRADKARSHKQGGAGLGLTLCKQIADVHGAEMNIESTEGAGTKIKISFTTP